MWLGPGASMAALTVLQVTVQVLVAGLSLQHFAWLQHAVEFGVVDVS